MRTPSRAGSPSRGREPQTEAMALRPLHDPVRAAAIAASHSRSTAQGLARIDTPDFARVQPAELTHALERNRRLYLHAAPVMALLHEQIVNSDSMVVLTDAAGTILHSVGDDDFLGRASQVALRPGANWSEAAKGTNAIGTALVAETPMLVHGDEHFLHANHFLTCSAAPILDPRGNLIGVLDVSGDQRSYHHHTLALVRLSARMIENRCLLEDTGHALRLHLHACAEFLGTWSEGVLALAPDGRIVGANRGAMEQLGQGGTVLRKHTLATLFDTTLSRLIDHFRSATASPLPLRTADGRVFMAVARFNAPLWWMPSTAAATVADPVGSPVADTLAVAAVPALPAPAAAFHEDLAAWHTGDPQVEAIVSRLQRVIAQGIPMLLAGETGTGKASLVRAVHRASAEAGQALHVLHGALAQPEAIEQAMGHGPALVLLEDVDELPAALQARLLTCAGRAARGRAVQLVATTRRDLRARVAAGDFREDLFHVLQGLAVTLPPLRERSDLRALAVGILRHEAAPGAPVPELADDAWQALARHPWPGNLRQLHLVLRTALALAAPAVRIERAHLPAAFADGPSNTAPAPTGAEGHTLDARQVAWIRQVLADVDGNLSEASRRLGISRNTIYRRLRAAEGNHDR